MIIVVKRDFDPCNYALVRSGAGVKLIENNEKPSFALPLDTLLKMPFFIFFDRLDHICMLSNSRNAELLNLESAQDLIGKHPDQWSNNPEDVIEPHEIIMKSNHFLSFDQEIELTRSHETRHLLSVQYPWYSPEGEMVGIYGCGIPVDDPIYAASLAHLVSLGFLSPESKTYIHSTKTFTRREQECIDLLLQGKTSRQMGEELNLSFRTVEHYIDKIKDKMDVSSKVQLILKLKETYSSK